MQWGYVLAGVAGALVRGRVSFSGVTRVHAMCAKRVGPCVASKPDNRATLCAARRNGIVAYRNGGVASPRRRGFVVGPSVFALLTSRAGPGCPAVGGTAAQGVCVQTGARLRRGGLLSRRARV